MRKSRRPIFQSGEYLLLSWRTMSSATTQTCGRESRKGRRSPPFAAALVLITFGSFAQLFTIQVAAADPPSPHASSCSEECDKKASDCVDACEEKFKDDAPRIKCKMTCIGDRQKCEKDCK
jgi:hypothetical protein